MERPGVSEDPEIDRLYLLELANTRRPTVLFLHGLGMGHRMWAPQIDALAGDYHILAPDLPGFARSRDSGPFSIQGCSQMLHALIDRSGAQRVHVVGLSLGALVAIQLAIDDSEGIVRSQLLSAGQVRPPRAVMRAQNVVLRLVPARSFERMIVSSIPGNDADVIAAAIEDARLTQQTGFLAGSRTAGAVDVTSALAGISTKTTIACGMRDRVNLRAARKLADLIPDAPLELIPGAGHVWNLEKPDVFNSLVRQTVGAAKLQN